MKGRSLFRQTRVILAVAAPLAVALGVVLVSASATSGPSGWLALDGAIRYATPSSASYDWGNSGTAFGTCSNGGTVARRRRTGPMYPQPRS